MNETEAKLPIYMRQSNNYCLKFAIKLWESKIDVWQNFYFHVLCYQMIDLLSDWLSELPSLQKAGHFVSTRKHVSLIS